MAVPPRGKGHGESGGRATKPPALPTAGSVSEVSRSMRKSSACGSLAQPLHLSWSVVELYVDRLEDSRWEDSRLESISIQSLVPARFLVPDQFL
jgi:hypothetical protein